MSGVNGYDLFYDVEDHGLRKQNQAQVMYNILVDNSTGNKITLAGTRDMVEYLQAVLPEDRVDVLDRLKVLMGETYGS